MGMERVGRTFRSRDAARSWYHRSAFFVGTASAQGLGGKMKDWSKYRKIGETTAATHYVAEEEPDVVISVPVSGCTETVVDARANTAIYYRYSSELGKPLGVVVTLANIRSQTAESRHEYAGIDPKSVYAAGLVVTSGLARALGNFFMGLSRPKAPTRLFDTMESAVDWLRTMRPRAPERDDPERQKDTTQRQ